MILHVRIVLFVLIQNVRWRELFLKNCFPLIKLSSTQHTAIRQFNCCLHLSTKSKFIKSIEVSRDMSQLFVVHPGPSFYLICLETYL